MTRAARQAGDVDSFWTPGLHSSVQMSMNDHGVCYYLYHNESAPVIPTILYYLRKSCQERLNLNEARRGYFKYELQFKI